MTNGYSSTRFMRIINMATEKPGSTQPAEESVDDLDESLMSMENIDRESPELWPEKIPGINEFMSNYSGASNNKMPYSKEFSLDDTNFLNHLSLLPPSGLISKVKELHDIAYQLGIEESKEMTRGKYLNLFDKPKKAA